MTPTLIGRLQTRVVSLATIGVLWTLVITPFLPGLADLRDGYAVTFRALAVVTVVGLVWELIYHGLQQFRWEKDWPTLFGLLNGVNEGIVAWFILIAVLPPDLEVTVAQYVVHFSTTWLVVWLFLNGPMRVVSLHWRFRGGRFV